MIFLKIKSPLLTIAIALIIAVVTAFFWLFGSPAFSALINATTPKNASFTFWKFVVLVFTAVSTALLIEIYGFKRSFPFVLFFNTIWFFTGITFAYFFGIGLAVLPVMIVSLATLSFVHLKKLWEIDRELTEKLSALASTGHLLEGKSADLRIESGLKLLETIFPVSEIIVFRLEPDGELNPIGRARKTSAESSLSKRQSAWRKCVELCEKALESRETQIQKTGSGKDAAQIALPLICDDVIIGVLYVDVKQDFEREDKRLLESFSRQLALNFQRQELRHKQLPHDAWWTYFSTQSLENRLDITNLVHNIIKEQSFSVIAGSYLHEAHAIAYLDGTLAYINQPMRYLADIQTNELPELDLFKLLEKFKTDVFNEPSLVIRRVMQTGDSFECELHIPEKNKTLGLQITLVKIPVKNKVIHLANVQKIPACFLITFRNISAVKENKKLRSDMAHLMSHELRTPITSIQGFAEMLLLEDNIPEDSRDFLKTIAAESNRASNILSNFLSVSNLQQSDKQEVIKTPVEINSVVDEVVEDFSQKAKQKRIRIIERKERTIPPISADKDLLTKAISQLLDNAIRYSPERTSVMISTILEADFLRIEVEDRGYGIPKGEQEKIWQKFYRVAHKDQDKQEETTGLGLSLVKEIIEQHNGQVGVQSVEGRGSRFSFRLPRL